MKKIIIVLSLLVLLTTMGATCDCGSSSKKKTASVNLVVWHVFDDESIMAPLIDLFEKTNPDISIEYVKKDFANYEQTTVDALASGTGPDVWMIKNDWVLKQHKKLVAQPKNLFAKSTSDTRNDVEIYEDMFPDIAAKDNIINGKIYGIPLFIDTLAVYYNKAHFSAISKDLISQKRSDEAKMFNYPPNNWEEFLKMSKLLTKKDSAGNITQSGAALGTSDNIGNAPDILALLMLQNNTVMSSADNLTSTINLPINKESGEAVYPGTQALGFYTSFADPTKDNYMWNSTMPDAVQAFEEGKVSMIIDYGGLRARLAQEVPKLNYGIGPMPQVAGSTTSVDYASYWVETVTNNSKNTAEAWKFIKFMYDHTGTYDSATDRPSPKRLNNLDIPITKERAIKGGVPFRYQIMTAGYWYQGNYPGTVDTILYDMIDNVVKNKVPFQTAIDKAASQITETYKISNAENIATPTPTATKTK